MNESSTSAANGNGNGRRRALSLFALIVVLGAVGYGAYWQIYLKHSQSTDDAYVSGDIVQVTSEVPGTLIAIHVDDTQSVHRGDVLAELDPADAKLAVESSEAELARVVRQVRGLYTQADQLRSQITEKDLLLQRATADLQRRQAASGDGAVSGEELNHAQEAVREQRAALNTAQEQLNTLNAQLDGATVETHPQVLAAATAVRNANLSLHRTQILAPMDGVIAKRAAQLGARIAAGAPLMAVVPLADVWVDANFKEVQLAQMRIGQRVKLHSDLYGSDVEFHGKVAGLSAGSGTAFALLPAQNASGNWIKIVQRVPVRVLVDAEDLKAHPLRVGLSMTVDVDIANTSGDSLAQATRNTPLPRQASDGDDPQVEARISQIIAKNAGHAPREGSARASDKAHRA